VGELYAQICSWENLRLAHRKAARGKRAAAGFEYNLADHLLELQEQSLSRASPSSSKAMNFQGGVDEPNRP